jgi:cell division septal protein FtsQ
MATDLRKTPAAQRVRRRRLRRNAALAFGAYLLAVGGLSAACYRAYFWALERPALALSAVEVRGLVRLTPEEVLSAAGVSEGGAVAALDLRRIERRLERLEWVEAACVRLLGWPLRLVIDIEEKTPVALIRLDRLYYLDENARPIKPLSPLEGMDYPVITGVAPSDLDDSRKLLSSRVIPLLARLGQERGPGGAREGECHLLAGGISEVHVAAGGRLSLYTLDGLLVRLGERDWRPALQEAGRVISDLGRRGILSDVAALNASCPGRVFVTFGRDKLLAATGKVRGA